MPRTKRGLTPPTTKPGFVVVEVVDSVDGGFCLVVDDERVAGCSPALHHNNIRYRWNVRAQDFLRALARATATA